MYCNCRCLGSCYLCTFCHACLAILTEHDSMKICYTLRAAASLASRPQFISTSQGGLFSCKCVGFYTAALLASHTLMHHNIYNMNFDASVFDVCNITNHESLTCCSIYLCLLIIHISGTNLSLALLSACGKKTSQTTKQSIEGLYLHTIVLASACRSGKVVIRSQGAQLRGPGQGRTWQDEFSSKFRNYCKSLA